MSIPSRPFGVELEFYNSPSDEVILWLVRELGYKVRNDDVSSKFDHWVIQDDTSIYGSNSKERVSMELSSRILKGAEGLEEVRKVCRLLQKLGCKVNATCGLHVHVSARHLKGNHFYSLFMRYAHHEKEIDTFIRKARRKNRCEFCRSHKNDGISLKALFNDRIERREMFKCNHFDFAEYVSGIGFGDKVTLSSNYDTIEFRHHHGTIDPTEVSNWIRFCLNFVEVSADLAPNTRRSTKRTKDTGPLMGLPTHVRNHFRYQAERFR